MSEPGATITAMPVSSNERTRVFPAAPGPYPALAVPRSSCSVSGSADERAAAWRLFDLFGIGPGYLAVYPASTGSATPVT